MEKKTCLRCGGRKLLAEFYKHPKMADGHLNFCKECQKTTVRAYAAANPEKIRKLTREKKRRPEYVARAKAWIARNPERSREIKRRWAEKNYAKKKTEWTLSNALRDGKIVKPKHCQKCGKAGTVEGHHPDYHKPLEVEWLCTKCHGETRHKS
jgi:hypothetical protein